MRSNRHILTPVSFQSGNWPHLPSLLCKIVHQIDYQVCQSLKSVYPVCQFASLPVCQFASLSVCQFASLQVCQSIFCQHVVFHRSSHYSGLCHQALGSIYENVSKRLETWTVQTKTKTDKDRQRQRQKQANTKTDEVKDKNKGKDRTKTNKQRQDQNKHTTPKTNAKTQFPLYRWLLFNFRWYYHPPINALRVTQSRVKIFLAKLQMFQMFSNVFKYSNVQMLKCSNVSNVSNVLQ